MSDDADTHDELESANYATFRDCFFAAIVEVSTSRSRSRTTKSRSNNNNNTTKRKTTNNKTTPDTIRKGSSSTSTTDTNLISSSETNDPSDLADFSDFIATETFSGLPLSLRCLTHQSLKETSELSEKYSLPLSLSVLEELAESIPPSVTDSLTAYGLITPPASDVQSFLAPIVAGYVSAVSVPPPKWIATRTTACEICEREWVPLTYHHLIPRGVHAKVLKRGWHDEGMLNSVAWLCRACHTFVHKMASNEELAREWYTVEKICSREDTQKWASWVGRVRWKKT